MQVMVIFSVSRIKCCNNKVLSLSLSLYRAIKVRQKLRVSSLSDCKEVSLALSSTTESPFDCELTRLSLSKYVCTTFHVSLLLLQFGKEESLHYPCVNEHEHHYSG